MATTNNTVRRANLNAIQAINVKSGLYINANGHFTTFFNPPFAGAELTV